MAERRCDLKLTGLLAVLGMVLVLDLTTDSEEVAYQLHAAQRQVEKEQKAMKIAIFGDTGEEAHTPFGAAVVACTAHPRAPAGASSARHFERDPVAVSRVRAYIGEIVRLAPNDSYALPASQSAPPLPVVFACNQSTATICRPGTVLPPMAVSAGQACDERVFTKGKTCFDDKGYAGDFRCMLINAADANEADDTTSASKPLPAAIRTLASPEVRRRAFETFPFVVRFGDVAGMSSTLLLVKSRPMKQPGLGVLLPLHRTRHFTKVSRHVATAEHSTNQ